jgi:uncharacterized membrane protein YebE (DUF533 family)
MSSDSMQMDSTPDTAAVPAAAAASATDGQLTEEERAIYDRQLRVWGVEAQKR